jgi:hypothetical protein
MSPSSPIILDGPSEPPSPQVPAIRRASNSPEASDEDAAPISGPVSSAAASDNEDFIVPMSEPVPSAAASETEEDVVWDQISAGDEMEEQLGEAWEDELEENLASSVQHPLRDWDEIRTEVKAELKKNSSIMPLSRLNQLMIISNFATLRLKGVSRTQAEIEIARQWHHGKGKGDWFARQVRSLARHYQLFGNLPRELRGGSRLAQSWLHDERVKLHALEYLCNIPAGKVTPRAFQGHINSSLFPELDIKPKNLLSIRTARRWSIKLGWTYTFVKKGVYMDGHERFDVVHYRDNEFLPAMLKFEERMVHYEYYKDKGSDFVRVEPKLKDGEQEIIPLFYDECCFHANDEANRAWYLYFTNPAFENTNFIHRLKEGQNVLRKKGRGGLIHVSDFLNPENGRLIIRDADGKVVQDSRLIIYPDSNGDPCWDTKQLLAQVKEAIRIFEAAHPGKKALFIFDQFSAHASLPEDALKAFEMNKSDGGKQHKQHDTIIPMSNPCETHRVTMKGQQTRKALRCCTSVSECFRHKDSTCSSLFAAPADIDNIGSCGTSVFLVL